MPSEAIKQRRAAWRLTHVRQEYKAGAVFGLFTLSRPDYQPGYLYGHHVHGGKWLCRCGGCGAMVSVHTRDLRRQTRKGYSCPKCPPPPGYYKSKQPDADQRVGRKPLPLVGRQAGRFTFLYWVRKTGWMCRCATCGGKLLFPNSQSVLRHALEPCAGECLHDG